MIFSEICLLPPIRDNLVPSYFTGLKFMMTNFHSDIEESQFVLLGIIYKIKEPKN